MKRIQNHINLVRDHNNNHHFDSSPRARFSIDSIFFYLKSLFFAKRTEKNDLNCEITQTAAEKIISLIIIDF